MQTPKYIAGWNINTILAVLALISLIAGGGKAYSDINAAIGTINKWIAKNETDDSMNAGRLAQKLSDQDMKLSEIPLIKQQQLQTEQNIGLINQRMDRSFVEMNSNFKEMRDVVNKMSTQMEVQGQILRRLEAQSGGSRSRMPSGTIPDN